eukprot:TRINITY_DN14699_c0_g1::TRINITY_DN14699_c0_g1_i1::g.21494::m.21494 TRINITY_DN14699_c0_g1::TRINITY_DN14699_c0_g1_i1::g.21494  ORF type:complete len:125 (+),score=20.65,DUF2259/PF10016.4/0.049 TRINITY_DN14699_c0_g1_i1:478-852(+)
MVIILDEAEIRRALGMDSGKKRMCVQEHGLQELETMGKGIGQIFIVHVKEVLDDGHRHRDLIVVEGSLQGMRFRLGIADALFNGEIVDFGDKLLVLVSKQFRDQLVGFALLIGEEISKLFLVDM